MCHNSPSQLTSEQETILDEQKEKLKEQLAILRPFTLVETEEEEAGMLFFKETNGIHYGHSPMIFWRLLCTYACVWWHNSSVMLSMASLRLPVQVACMKSYVVNIVMMSSYNH